MHLEFPTRRYNESTQQTNWHFLQGKIQPNVLHLTAKFTRRHKRLRVCHGCSAKFLKFNLNSCQHHIIFQGSLEILWLIISMVKSVETDCVRKHLLLILAEPKHILSNIVNQMEIRKGVSCVKESILPIVVASSCFAEDSRRFLNMAQDRFVYISVHMWLRPPPNLIWVIGSEYILSAS